MKQKYILYQWNFFRLLLPSFSKEMLILQRKNEIKDESMEMNIYHKIANRFSKPVNI